MSFTTALSCSECSGSNASCRHVITKSSIFTAAEYGDFSRIESVVERNPKSLNLEDSGGCTALHYAAQHNRVQVVKFLCRNGANVNANNCGATPLHRASFAGSLESVVTLVEARADLYLRDMNRYARGRMAHHKAAEQGHSAILNYLLQVDAGLTNQVDSDSKTAEELLQQSGNSKQTISRYRLEISDPKYNDDYEETKEKNIGAPCAICKKLKYSFAHNPRNKKLICQGCAQEGGL